MTPHNKTALYYLNLVSVAKYKRAAEIARGIIPSRIPMSARIWSIPAQGRRQYITKLDRIRLDSVGYDGVPLGDSRGLFECRDKKRDPEKRGINFLVNQDIAGGANISALPALGPDGKPLPAAPTERWI